jgi:glycosyltransferase involved in cell wall biosynthesis
MSRKHKVETPVAGEVYWLLESNGLSGGVRVIFEMAKGLVESNWKVTVLSLNDRPAWFQTSSMAWEMIPNYNLMIDRIKRLPSEARVIATWWNTARVLEVVKHPSSYYLVQDDESHYYSAQVMKDLVTKTYEMGFRMFTTSNWVRRNIFGVHYVGIGIHQNRFKSLGNSKRQVFAIGRRQQIKGWKYLLELSQRISIEASMPLVVASVDPHLKVSGGAEIKVNLPDGQIAREYATSRYFASCSVHEGFCLPNLEAMASGCAVVTTNSDGNMDYSVNRENCIIVGKQDPREMVEAFLELETNKPLRDKIIKGGLETASKWRWAPVHERLNSFLTT